jgi:hypothetical protein
MFGCFSERYQRYKKINRLRHLHQKIWNVNNGGRALNIISNFPRVQRVHYHGSWTSSLQVNFRNGHEFYVTSKSYDDQFEKRYEQSGGYHLDHKNKCSKKMADRLYKTLCSNLLDNGGYY